MHDISEGAPNRTLLSVFLIMSTNKFRRLPITKIGKIFGILTASDLLRAIANEGLPTAFKARIDTYMTPNPVTINLNAPVSDAIRIMYNHHFGSLIVTGDSPDRIQGILTEYDILRLAADFPWRDLTIAQLREDFIKDHLLVFDEATPLLTAINAMAKNNFYWIVVTYSNQFFGLVTANDIINFISKERDEITTNSNFLTSVTLKLFAQHSGEIATPSDRISDVMAKMLSAHVGGIPIVENNAVVGIFTERDLLSYFNALFE